MTELVRKYKLSIVYGNYKDFCTFTAEFLCENAYFSPFFLVSVAAVFSAECLQLLGVGAVNKSIIVMNNNDSIVIDLLVLD